MKKKIAVVLSGCGNKDGSEITEAVSLIISLSYLGAEMTFFAPNKNFQPMNFLSLKPMDQSRNVLEESARVCRGQIQALENLYSKDFDGLALPGGYGAATQLSNWAEKGARCQIETHLEKVIKDFHSESKPIAAICIAPVIIARVLGHHKVVVTVGKDPETVSELKKTGADHEECPLTDYITDRENKVITTPAYMYGNAKPHEIFLGIQGLVKEFLEMA
jgi:enhancing lycopene biosynthesis protein 2